MLSPSQNFITNSSARTYIWTKSGQIFIRQQKGHCEHCNKDEVLTAVFPSEMVASCWGFVSLNTGKMIYFSTKESSGFNFAKTLQGEKENRPWQKNPNENFQIQALSSEQKHSRDSNEKYQCLYLFLHCPCSLLHLS